MPLSPFFSFVFKWKYLALFKFSLLKVDAFFTENGEIYLQRICKGNQNADFFQCFAQKMKTIFRSCSGLNFQQVCG